MPFQANAGNRMRLYSHQVCRDDPTPLVNAKNVVLIKSKPLALVVDVGFDVGLLCRPAKPLGDMPPCAIQEAKRLVARRHRFVFVCPLVSRFKLVD